MYGRVDLDEPAHLLHGGQQRVDLQRAALLQILQHRGAVRADTRRAVDAPLDIDAEMHADAAADLLGLQHHVAGEVARAGVGRDHVQRRLGQRRDRVEAEIAPELEPDVVADLGIDGAASGRPSRSICDELRQRARDRLRFGSPRPNWSP